MPPTRLPRMNHQQIQDQIDRELAQGRVHPSTHAAFKAAYAAGCVTGFSESPVVGWAAYYVQDPVPPDVQALLEAAEAEHDTHNPNFSPPMWWLEK
jgi:hypothetical protein